MWTHPLGAPDSQKVEHDAGDDEEDDAAGDGHHPPLQVELPVLPFGVKAVGALQGIVPGDLVAVASPIGLGHLAGEGDGH